MSPVPAKAICCRCCAELFRTRYGWQHAEDPMGTLPHVAEPMSDEEREAHEARVRELLASVELVPLPKVLPPIHDTLREYP